MAGTKIYQSVWSGVSRMLFQFSTDKVVDAVVLVDSDGNERTAANPVPVGTSPAGTLTAGYTVAVSLTRTADTNAYLANDVIGAATGATAALTFALMGPSGGNIRAIAAELEIDRNAVISGETSYRLHLYSVTPPSALGDNAAWDLPSGDRASYLGFVELGTPVDLGSTLYVQSEPGKDLQLAGTSLFGYLVTIGAYTPASATVHKITLHAVAY